MNTLFRAVTAPATEAASPAIPQVRAPEMRLEDLLVESADLGRLSVSVELAARPALFGPRHTLGRDAVSRLADEVSRSVAGLEAFAQRLADALIATGLTARVRVAVEGAGSASAAER